MFNRRRQGEASKVTVNDYLQGKEQNHSKDVLTNLSQFEKALCEKLCRIEVVGKRGRTVPIIFTESMKDSLECLLRFRKEVVTNENNHFIFARLHKESIHHIRGSDCLREVVKEIPLQQPDFIRSTALRKHIAIMTQLHNMKDNELDVLAQYMGHDIRIHREHYRLPSATIQVAKVAKFLLSMEHGHNSTEGEKEDDENEDSALEDDENEDFFEHPLEKECLDSFAQDTHNHSELRGLGVERPRTLTVSVLEEAMEGEQGYTIVSNLKVIWTSPASGLSRKYVKGFDIRIHYDGYATFCRFYTVDHSAYLTSNDELKFEFTVPRVADGTSYDINVYSLPPSETMDQPGTFLSDSVTTANFTTFPFPADWKPEISVEPSYVEQLGTGNIEVRFKLPPKLPDYKLTHFRISLYTGSSCAFDDIGVEKLWSDSIIKETNTSDTEASYEFKNLENARYFVVVLVQNYKYDDKVCICKKKSYCSASCGVSRTGWFDLKGNKGCLLNEVTDSTPTIDITNPSTESTANGTLDAITATSVVGDPKSTSMLSSPSSGETSQSVSATKIIIIAVSIAIIGSLVVICVLVWWKRCRNQDKASLNPPTPVMSDVFPHNLKNKTLDRKTIYLAAVSDHQDSALVIDMFAEILKTYCHCTVINPRDMYRDDACESAWVAAQTGKCDFIIFVNSYGAARLIDAYLDGVRSYSNHAHSMFNKVVQKAFKTASDTKLRCITVTFTQDWIEGKCDVLNDHKKYDLSKHMANFLRKLHNLSEREADSLKGQLPLMTECHHNLPQWKPFLDAIQDLDSFEKGNPDWFVSKYNFTSGTSMTDHAALSSTSSSGYASTLHGGALSVSSTDLPSVFGEAPLSKDPDKLNEGIGMHDHSASLAVHNASQEHILDVQSWVTVGKVSDVRSDEMSEIESVAISLRPKQPISPPPLDDVDTDNFSIVIHNHNSQTSPSEIPKGNESTSTLGIHPPEPIKARSGDDSLSARIASHNNNLSVWSREPGHNVTCL